jgi:hypothetical protein
MNARSSTRTQQTPRTRTLFGNGGVRHQNLHAAGAKGGHHFHPVVSRGAVLQRAAAGSTATVTKCGHRPSQTQRAIPHTHSPRWKMRTIMNSRPWLASEARRPGRAVAKPAQEAIAKEGGGERRRRGEKDAWSVLRKSHLAIWAGSMRTIRRPARLTQGRLQVPPFQDFVNERCRAQQRRGAGNDDVGTSRNQTEQDNGHCSANVVRHGVHSMHTHAKPMQGGHGSHGSRERQAPGQDGVLEHALDTGKRATTIQTTTATTTTTNSSEQRAVFMRCVAGLRWVHQGDTLERPEGGGGRGTCIALSTHRDVTLRMPPSSCTEAHPNR